MLRRPLVLVINAGSSSVKVRLLDGSDGLAGHTDLRALEDALSLEDLVEAMRSFPTPDVVAHRVVHGGDRFRASAVVTDGVEQAIEELIPLAPLHNGAALAGIRQARQMFPGPHVACFDTVFHQLPAEAATFAIPEEWRGRWGLRRFGFHGLSHAYASRRAATLVGRPVSDLRIVVCHLGAGASVCAVHGGRSVDTTMGFTPLDGLVMATRSGSVDPGALLWLQQVAGLTPGVVQEALEHRSGLLGLSGMSGRPDDLYEAAEAGNERARLALDVYLHRLCGLVAAMAASAAGLDVLVFTGGVGEHCARLRQEAAGRLAWLGVALGDQPGNGGDAVISPSGQWPAVCVVEAREDLEMAREARRVLGLDSPPGGAERGQ